MLCVAENEVREAYTVEQWMLSSDEGRKEFIGHVASQEIRNKWVGMDSTGIESRYGVANTSVNDYSLRSYSPEMSMPSNKNGPAGTTAAIKP